MSSIGKNIGLSIFTFISRIISGSVVFIVLARLMSLNDFGLLSFGTTLAGLLTVVAEFGFSLMAQRDIPQEKFEFKAYVNNVLLQKGGFTLLAVVIGVIYLFFNYTGKNVTIGFIFVLNAVVTSYIMYFFAVFRAKNMFKIESQLSIVYSVIVVFVVFLYYLLELDILFIAKGLIFARMVQLFLVSIKYLRLFKPRFKYDNHIQKYLLKHSFSFGAHYIIGIFYFTVDNQMIAYYCGNESLAIYQAIFKIVLILLSVNALFEGVFLPFLSARYKLNSSDFVKLTTLINKIVVFLGLLVFMSFAFFSEFIVTILYGEKYLASLSIVLPLALILVIRSFSSMYSLLLTISNHQNIRVLVVVISLVVNVVLNFIFIPRFNFIGAAYVSLITHIILVFLYGIFAYRIFKSGFIEGRLIVFSVFTIAMVSLKFFFDIQLSFTLSCCAVLVWMLLSLFVINKKQILELKDVMIRKN